MVVVIVVVEVEAVVVVSVVVDFAGAGVVRLMMIVPIIGVSWYYLCMTNSVLAFVCAACTYAHLQTQGTTCNYILSNIGVLVFSVR